VYTAENVQKSISMPDIENSTSPPSLATFGKLLKYLRKRAQLTQRELAIAVGYSEAHVSRLESNERLPDLTTLAALFVPALGLEDEPETIARFLELAAIARGDDLPSSGKLMLFQSIETVITQTLERASVPSNLPLQLTSFIGRETEIEEIKELLQGTEKVRLLTLVGAGGCGKTRLAVQVAEGLVLDFPHGVWFVDLAPLTEPNLIPRTVASIFGLPETSAQETIKSLITFLHPRKVLILFDNCEHILSGVSSLVESILRACPQVQAMATSREVLNIPGENQFHILPLPYPPEDSNEKNVIANFASVRLFIQRAKNIQTSFELTNENSSSVAQVCRRLDGIPLAIELAAARVGLLRPRQIEAQLNDRFQLLTSGSRTLPRHQTLHAMIDWSHDLLSDDERRLFRRLSIFAGGWTLEAAEGVSDHSLPISTLDLLSRLRDKSFIIVERNPGDEARYSMLETLREYAFEKLEGATETAETREQHFEFFYQFARKASLYGPEKQAWIDRVEADFDNIRAAVTWALAYRDTEGTQPYVEEATELVLALVDFFWYRGFVTEAREWMDKFIATGTSVSPLHALLLQKAGWFARVSGDFKKADMLLHRALKMANEIGDKNRSAYALMDLGISIRDQGDNDQALSYLNEALVYAQESGENRAIGNCMYLLAESYSNDLDRAKSLWERGLEILQKEGDRMQYGWGIEGLAGVAFLRRDFASAYAFHIESLRAKLEIMDKPGIVYSLEGIGQVAAAEDEPERAAVLWGAAHRLREVMNLPPDPSREEVYTSLIPQARAQIGKDLFEELWKKGERMKLEDAIEYALHNKE
jgi:predicted ATPase/transcriptional regulator with XRE-family HTH domain